MPYAPLFSDRDRSQELLTTALPERQPEKRSTDEPQTQHQWATTSFASETSPPRDVSFRAITWSSRPMIASGAAELATSLR